MLLIKASHRLSLESRNEEIDSVDGKHCRVISSFNKLSHVGNMSDVVHTILLKNKT